MALSFHELTSPLSPEIAYRSLKTSDTCSLGSGTCPTRYCLSVGNSGIGFETDCYLANRGATLIISSRSAQSGYAAIKNSRSAGAWLLFALLQAPCFAQPNPRQHQQNAL